MFTQLRFGFPVLLQALFLGLETAQERIVFPLGDFPLGFGVAKGKLMVFCFTVPGFTNRCHIFLVYGPQCQIQQLLRRGNALTKCFCGFGHIPVLLSGIFQLLLSGIHTNVLLLLFQTGQTVGVVTQQIPRGTVRVLLQFGRILTADDAAQQFVEIYSGQKIFTGYRGGQGMTANGRFLTIPMQRTAVQKTDSSNLLSQLFKGVFCGGVMIRRNQNVKSTVTHTGFHTILPACVIHIQQFAEYLCIRFHSLGRQCRIDFVFDKCCPVFVWVDQLSLLQSADFCFEITQIFCHAFGLYIQIDMETVEFSLKRQDLFVQFIQQLHLTAFGHKTNRVWI